MSEHARGMTQTGFLRRWHTVFALAMLLMLSAAPCHAHKFSAAEMPIVSAIAGSTQLPGMRIQPMLARPRVSE